MTFLLRRVLVHCVWEKHGAKYENRPLKPMSKISLLYYKRGSSKRMRTLIGLVHFLRSFPTTAKFVSSYF